MKTGRNEVKKAEVSMKKHPNGSYHVTVKSTENSGKRTYITSMKLGAESMVENIQNMVDDGCDFHTITSVVQIVLQRDLRHG